ncbi:MAG: hypothetical protein PHW63_04485, partial [Alphaproteobacteria bacterium]|nr:hypothetical protein [Alphaproteobacteria bacterium]
MFFPLGDFDGRQALTLIPKKIRWARRLSLYCAKNSRAILQHAQYFLRCCRKGSGGAAFGGRGGGNKRDSVLSSDDEVNAA